MRYVLSMSEILKQPGILVSPRSLSSQDPSHPKIPVNPRSQSAQDPSQHWMPSCLFGSCLFGIWLMPIWYLAYAIKFFKHILHTYLDFSHAYLAHSHFSQSKKPHEPRTCCRIVVSKIRSKMAAYPS